jgi:hypothetical protein
VALLGGAGCSRPVLPAAPHRYVRLDALLPLHPSWEQIRALEREVARLKTASVQAGSFQYEPHLALSTFTPRLSPPANMAVERAAQVDRDARRYVDSLRKSLTDANRSIISIERRREQRRVDADVAARLAEAARALKDENDVQAFAIRKRLEALATRDIVVRSQIQDLAQARTLDRRPLRTAQAEHAAIVADMARLKEESTALLAEDVARMVAGRRDVILRDEQAKSRDRLAKREEELKGEIEDKLAAAMRAQRDTAIPPPAAPRLPAPDPRTTPLPLPAGASAPIVAAPTLVQPALDRQSAIWQAQRGSLIAEIRADTAKAVEQVAMRRGWILVAGPQGGATDATDEAADDLRAQWQMGK